MKRQKQKKCMWRRQKGRKKKNAWKERQREREWMSATLWRACLDFSTPENALSDSGSVALTPISAYAFTLPCATVMRETNNVSASERAWQTERKYAIVRKCNPLTVLEASTRNTYLLYSHTCLPPSSAARRHFRNSALPLWPSSLRWLHGKQTRLKETPCSLSTERKKGMTHSVFLFSWLHLVLSTIQLSIFPGDICLILCQHFTAIRAAIVWNAVLTSNAAFYGIFWLNWL